MVSGSRWLSTSAGPSPRGDPDRHIWGSTGQLAESNKAHLLLVHRDSAKVWGLKPHMRHSLKWKWHSWTYQHIIIRCTQLQTTDNGAASCGGKPEVFKPPHNMRRTCFSWQTHKEQQLGHKPQNLSQKTITGQISWWNESESSSVLVYDSLLWAWSVWVFLHWSWSWSWPGAPLGLVLINWPTVTVWLLLSH